ncbi:MAG: helix-turn-helix domain-containing protein [Gaiellales bacterium]
MRSPPLRSERATPKVGGASGRTAAVVGQGYPARAPSSLPAPPLLLTVPEAARLLGIGTTLAYELIGHGDLPHVRLGRALRVPRRTLEEWIASRTRAAPHDQAPPEGLVMGGRPDATTPTQAK